MLCFLAAVALQVLPCIIYFALHVDKNMFFFGCNCFTCSCTNIFLICCKLFTGSCKDHGKGPYPHKTPDHKVLCPQVPATRCISSYSGNYTTLRYIYLFLRQSDKFVQTVMRSIIISINDSIFPSELHYTANNSDVPVIH